jgi:hypothetical protein
MLRSTFCEMSSCSLKSRISITAGHQPAGGMRILHDYLEGRTSSGAVETGHALSLHDCRAASQGRTCVFDRISTTCKTVPCVTSVINTKQNTEQIINIK